MTTLFTLSDVSWTGGRHNERVVTPLELVRHANDNGYTIVTHRNVPDLVNLYRGGFLVAEARVVAEKHTARGSAANVQNLARV